MNENELKLSTKLITTPQPKGWRENIEDEAYHADKSAVNCSSLKYVEKSMFAFARAFWGKSKPATDSMNFGKLAHMALLEGPKFQSRYVVVPEFESFDAKGNKSESKNTTHYKNELAKWKSDLPKDSVIVTQEERERVLNMLDSVLSNQAAVQLLSNGKPEIAGYWTDEETGINLRIKPDFLAFNLGIMCDLKTCQDVRWRHFRKNVENYRYDFQMAMYAEGVKQITGQAPQHTCWLTVESDGAHEVRIHDVSPIYQEIGAWEFRNSLKKLKEAIDSKQFAQGNDEIIVGEPSYYFIKDYVNRGILNEI